MAKQAASEGASFIDRSYLQPGLAGVDEAGRGPLAGPVTAAAVILNPAMPIEGLMDSKQLTEMARERLYIEIVNNAIAVGIGRAEADEIDQLNILQASLLAMQRAVMNLADEPSTVWVDGLYCPKIPYSSQALVKGDQKMVAISAASIVAKVLRDREMVALDKQYPGYGFAKHKGYPTAQHRLALQELGPCPIHRRSFAPVKRCLLV